MTDFDIGAKVLCKPEQIHWNNTVGKRPKCFDCPDCLPGSEPSVPCGGSVNDWPDIHCVSCKLGKTYSDKYDTSPCKACTICSKGRAVKNSCTLTTDTKCDSKCGPGFYTVRLISGCFPCTQCCDDGKDELAVECANNKKKCKVRPAPCTRVETTPSKPTNRNYSTSKPIKRNYSTSNTSPTIQTAGDRTTKTVNEEEKTVSGELTVLITPNSTLHNYTTVLKPGVINIKMILLITVPVWCTVLFLFISVIIAKKGKLGRDMLRSPRKQDSNHEGCNIFQVGTPPLLHSSALCSQDFATPLLNRSESPQPNRSATPQHIVSTSLHTNEAVSSQPKESESPEPNRSTSLHSSDSLSPQAREYELPQHNISRSVSPQPSESVSSQPDGSASTHPNQSAAAAAAQSNRPAQEQVKSNPGELLSIKSQHGY